MMSSYSPLRLLRLTACAFTLAAVAPALASAAPGLLHPPPLKARNP